MIPWYTVLLIAVMGAIYGGITGFVIGGVAGYLLVIVFSLGLKKINGGVIPSRVRDETATDFIASHPELVTLAFPDMSPYQAKKRVGLILENIAQKSLALDPSINCDVNPFYFVISARAIEQEETKQEIKDLIRGLLAFLRDHPQWMLKIDY